MEKRFTYLLANVAFLFIVGVASAQGGLTPFTGSTHEYTVTAEDDVNNTLAWSVVEGISGVDYVISDDDTETVTIVWNTAGTYTLQFSETATGSGCITLKEVTVVVSANAFDVTISDSTIACNAADGIINFLGSDTTSVVSFTVDTVGVDWDHNWEIQFTLSSSATISDVAATAGDVISGTGTALDPYVVTNILGTVPSIDITMKVTGDAFSQQSVAVEIVSATELKYDGPALLGENIVSTAYVNAIPNTSGIITD